MKSLGAPNLRTPLADHPPQSCWAFKTARHEKPGIDIVDDMWGVESSLGLTGNHLPEGVLLDSDLPGVYIEDLLPRLHAIATHPIGIVMCGQFEKKPHAAQGWCRLFCE
jgi:hypothetical protein